MHAFTYADRARLLDELERLGETPNVPTSELCTRVSSVLEGASSTSALAEPLVRNVARLSPFLDRGGHESALAVGAIRHFLDSWEGREAETPAGIEVLLHTGVVVTELALAHLESEAGQLTGYLPWAASAEQRRRAEDMLMGFYQQPLLADAQLRQKTLEVRHRLSSLEGAGVFGRFVRNVDYILGVLEAPESSAEQRAWSRAALSYLIRHDDVISDELGLIGLLDDALVLELAGQLIGPDREPWQDLLDALFVQWPFLHRIILHGEGGIQAISEFLLVNAALLCDGLREKNGSYTSVVLPDTGNLPVLLAFLRTLGAIQDCLKERAPAAFSPGQTVCLDNSCYAQFESLADLPDPLQAEGAPHQKGFWLRYWPRQDRPKRKWLPLSELPRLVAAPFREYPRGPVESTLDRSESSVSAAEQLFHLEHPSAFSDLGLKTLIVANPGKARAFAKQTLICGHKLSDAIPIGHFGADGSWRLWSSRFTGDRPLLGVVSDLPTANLLLEFEVDREDVPAVVVDLSGARLKHAHSIETLRRLTPSICTLVQTREAATHDALHRCGFQFWEWGPKAASQMVWSVDRPHVSGAALAGEEAAVRRSLRFAPELERVSLAASLAAEQHLTELGSHYRARGPDVPADLEELLSHARRIFFGLLRQVTPDDSPDTSRDDTSYTELLDALDTTAKSSLFLSREERAAAEGLHGALSQMLEAHHQTPLGPKLERLLALIDDDPLARLVVENSHQVENLSSWLAAANRTIEVLSVATNSDFKEGTAILAGWYNRQRTPRLLSPPVGDRVVLVLYDAEAQWYELWNRTQEVARERRQGASNRRNMFPTVHGWSAPQRRQGAHAEEIGSPVLASLQERVDPIEWHELRARRERALQSVRTKGPDDSCEATLFWLEDGRYAFFTPHRILVRVTDVVKDQTLTEVEEITADQVEEGDYLLIPVATDTDLIRELADRHLPAGTRARADLWRNALRAYVEEESLSVAELQERLAAAGCHRHTQTLRGWLDANGVIAPRSPSDVAIIAALSDTDLASRLEECNEAVSVVRAAHLRAGAILAGHVTSHIRGLLSQGQSLAELDDVIGSVALVRVAEVEEEPVVVTTRHANRILGDGS